MGNVDLLLYLCRVKREKEHREIFRCQWDTNGNITGLNSHATTTAALAAKQLRVNKDAPDSIPPGQFYNFRTLPAHWSSHHTTYWQHPDHLGSASWVTDTNGRGYQHLQYRAWGEPFIEQNSTANGYETRYTFSGKERDEQTGFSYFGSRYYNSSLSIWLSVDPMADKYPSMSPYVYCANNPVRLVDPNGRELSENLDKWRYNRSDGTLMWISDEGGSKNQTVEFVHNNKQDGKLYYDEIKSINYDGYIGDMFNFSVVSPKIDGVFSGILDIYNGGEMFCAGAALGIGSEGIATPLAVAICGAGGSQVVEGFYTIMSTLTGGNGKYDQQKMVRDFCKSGVNFISSFTKDLSKKDIIKSFGGLAASSLWSGFLYYFSRHPKMSKELPPNSKITRSNAK